MVFLRRLWGGFRSWPLWAQIPVGTLVGLFAIGIVAAPFTEDDTRDIATEVAVERSTTTTSTSTTTTTSTTSSTTTTTTTVPPTTVPPATTRATTAPRTAPPATDPPSGGCHSSYSGACVPIASDVDCGGGSGNGPAYVYEKRFRVVGPDVYDLDGNDNDGIACES